MSEANQPPEYNEDVVYAMRALLEGKANEGQQQTAINWIVNFVCRPNSISYRNEKDGGPMATAFAEGRRFVGVQILKMKLPATLEAAKRRGGTMTTEE